MPASGAGKIRVSIEDLPKIKCPDCGGIYFDEAKIIRVLSALQSPSGDPGIIPDVVLVCINCKHVFNGDGLKKAMDAALIGTQTSPIIGG
jgi:hypothetical protein